jgi:hypothetical protein
LSVGFVNVAYVVMDADTKEREGTLKALHPHIICVGRGELGEAVEEQDEGSKDASNLSPVRSEEGNKGAKH